MVFPAREWEGGFEEKKEYRRLFERASYCVHSLTLLCTFCASSLANQDTRPSGGFESYLKSVLWGRTHSSRIGTQTPRVLR